MPTRFGDTVRGVLGTFMLCRSILQYAIGRNLEFGRGDGELTNQILIKINHDRRAFA